MLRLLSTLAARLIEKELAVRDQLAARSCLLGASHLEV